MGNSALPTPLLFALAGLSLVLLSGCFAHRSPAPPEEAPVWSPERRIVRRSVKDLPKTTNPASPPPESNARKLRPGMLSRFYPLPEGLTPLQPGEIEIYSVNTRKRERVLLFSPNGKLDEHGVKRMRHILRDWRKDKTRAPNRRLLTILYIIAQVYGRPLDLVSGYRHPKRIKKKMSRHKTGRAADIRVPGVPMADLAHMVRAHFEHVGVGAYPVSDFVHIDVRQKSYYWVDRSGPGQKKRDRAIPIKPKPPKGSDWTVQENTLPPSWRF